MEKHKKDHPTTQFWQWTIFILLAVFFHTGLSDNTVAGSEVQVPDSDPDFEPMPNNIRVAVGSTVYLTCLPRSLRNKTVSWIRHRDIHILAMGRTTYTNDQRFSVHHQRHTGEWTLQLQFAQPRDSGLYECQIGTQPIKSFFVNLQVVAPMTSILGGPEIFLDKGSLLNISCIVQGTTAQPKYFFWKHNGNVIRFDEDRYEMRQHFATSETTVSSLVIKSAQLSDSGNYSCMPAYCPTVSTRVFVLRGEKPAAMQTSSATPTTKFTVDSARFFSLLQIFVLYVMFYML